VTNVDRDFLFGRWRLVAQGTSNAFHFAPSGDVVHTFSTPGGIGRIVLLWRIEAEDVLVTEEPASGKLTRTPVSIDGARLKLGDDALYEVDSAAEPFDPLSGLYVFAASALRHGMAQVERAEAIEPFLLVQREKLELQRFHYPSPEAAEEAASRAAKSLPKDTRAVAWVYDAFITSIEDQQRTAAVMSIVSERGLPNARVFAQRYKGGGQLLGAIAVAGERPSWL
jgi:hypothetical protein